ncbi:Chemotaxis protein CheA [bacterium HR30]|nr:Chemotaxis protein CheA [bacterium HR30]
MNVEVESSKTNAAEKALLDVFSSVRAAAASGMWDDASRVIASLQEPDAPEGRESWLRWRRNVGRALLLLQTSDRATDRREFSSADVRVAISNLLWFGECLVEEPDTSAWLRAWEQQWRTSLPQPLQACLDADDATFRSWLEDAPPSTSAVAATCESAAADEGELADAENELLHAFLAEMDEGLRRAEDLLLQFERSPTDLNLLHALFRQYHTLKGAAGAVDLQSAAEQLHQGESLLQALRDGELELSPSAVVDFFLRLGDSVRAMVEEACGRKPTTTKIDNLDDAIAALLQGDSSSGSASVAGPLPAGTTFVPVSAAESSSTITPSSTSSIAHLQVLREKAAKGQLDPELVAIIEALEQRAEFFASMAASLQAEVRELRTVPADDLFRRLARPLRDAVRHESKRARLETLGAHVRIPKDLAEPVAEILLHLVRNAVAHGIESPQERERLGKDAEGLIRVSVEENHAALRICVADDGRGIDFAAVREKAIALGWLGADSPSDEETLQSFLFRPGFSTRNAANAVAGRGVGMDVVASQVQQLSGRVALRSTPGHGTTVEVLLPLATTGGMRP